ncbi:hypothetical protein COT63_02560 [Candidatus Shapirobacteria bacterium CG09_land_8_20_14_0_10_38_17]|uniref:Glycosyl transferase family 1 domain-containing protein n=1 Tax=Candidatus Shapirobacteria bacterium CG09_land_8_20_14_0_10_38_17 TaxID=1974884 RepID=A0A2H0WQL1_9BACT|nr:MAG: hypothetical protein COT63_02560 [Candidatus Shapirobacteria bacterium CG09_land_8_20_14_0_10_38_17]
MIKKNICIYNLGVGNTELLVQKMLYWQKKEINIKMVCPEDIIPQFKKLIKDISYVKIPHCKIAKNKFVLVFELLKRSFTTCFFIPQITKDTDVLYSISSVLDVLLLPFFIKIFKSQITWTALFENKVYLCRPGNFFIRLLAFWFYQISLLLLRKADKIFVISPELKSFLINRGFKKEKIILTGNAVDRGKIKKAIALKKHWCDGLFLGRIDEAKGVFDLVKICQLVVKKYPDFILWITGSGDQNTKNKLVKKIKELKLGKNIKLLGYVSGFKKFRLLANCRVFLFPSKSESFGVALLEAICSGKIAIAYDLPAYKTIYLNNELITVPLNDINAFAKKVINVLNQKRFKNINGLKLLNSPQYQYDHLAQLEMDNFKKR